jgi:asparagine synthetase B (glutamine-hydrolysing)
MCGFVALIGGHGARVERDVSTRSTDLIEYWGLDEAGFYFEVDVGFGFRRLSILDLSATGHQLMRSDDGNFVIIFDSEIFNNWKAVAQYFVNEETFYKNIYQIMPGMAFEIGQNRERHRWSFWTLPDEEPDLDFDSVDKLERLFGDAVKLRMRSDAPVGVTSSGLDSTSTICCMADLKAKMPGGSPEPTMAFSFNDKDFDESH